MTTRAPADSADIVRRVTSELGLVDIIARQLRKQLGGALDIEELASAGREGLLSAARSFDDGKGVPFRRWANLRIRGAMLDFVRQQGGLPRRVYKQVRALKAAADVQAVYAEEDTAVPKTDPAAADERLGACLSGMAMAMAMGFLSPGGSEEVERAESDSAGADEQLERREMLDLVRSLIEQRPESEKVLLKRHYFDGVTFEEAAREIGLSKSWASRLHARAVEAIGRELKKLTD